MTAPGGTPVTAVDVLVEKAVKAAVERGRGTVVLAGGVAANSRLRAQLASECEGAGLGWTMPSVPLCQDNAVMVAACADRPATLGRFTRLDVGAEPSLTIGSTARAHET